MTGDSIEKQIFIEGGQRAWNKVFNGTHILPTKSDARARCIGKGEDLKSGILRQLKGIFKK